MKLTESIDTNHIKKRTKPRGTLIGAHVNDMLHGKLKQQAAREDRSLASLLRVALGMYLRIKENNNN